MNTTIARALLKQRGWQSRTRMIQQFLAVLVLLFTVNGFTSNWSSPRKVIPQTCSAVAIGYMLLRTLTVIRFPAVVEFIDWDKVEAAINADDVEIDS